MVDHGPFLSDSAPAIVLEGSFVTQQLRQAWPLQLQQHPHSERQKRLLPEAEPAIPSNQPVNATKRWH